MLWECPAFQPMLANVSHVCHRCLCPSSGHHFAEGVRSFPAAHKYTSISAWSRASGPFCSLLTPAIHMRFDLFSPAQPQCQLPPAESWAVHLPGPLVLFTVALGSSLLLQPLSCWAALRCLVALLGNACWWGWFVYIAYGVLLLWLFQSATSGFLPALLWGMC